MRELAANILEIYVVIFVTVMAAICSKSKCKRQRHQTEGSFGISQENIELLKLKAIQAYDYIKSSKILGALFEFFIQVCFTVLISCLILAVGIFSVVISAFSKLANKEKKPANGSARGMKQIVEVTLSLVSGFLDQFEALENKMQAEVAKPLFGAEPLKTDNNSPIWSKVN